MPTTSTIQNWETACKEQEEINSVLLDKFEAWLKQKNFVQKTINTHVGNVKLYINNYLLYSDITSAKDGATHISGFLGYWFIKKAMWSSASSIRSNASSLKKFYTFMVERGNTPREDLELMKEDIHEEMDEWVATLHRYDDQAVTDMEEVWGM